VGYRMQQRFLVSKGEHRLEQEHDVEPATRNRWNPRHFEAARKIAGSLARDGDCIGARIHAQIGTPQLSRDEPSGPGNPAAEVKHGEACRDSGLPGQGSNLRGAHEALLLDELPRDVRGRAGSLQGPDEGCALVLVHGFSARTLTISRLNFPLTAV